MKTISYHKLVRDKMPELFEQWGKTCTYVVLNELTYEYALRRKLLEEAEELFNAQTEEELIEEIADLEEVIDALRVFKLIAIDRIERKSVEKFNERGGFKKGVYLKTVTEP